MENMSNKSEKQHANLKGTDTTVRIRERLREAEARRERLEES